LIDFPEKRKEVSQFFPYCPFCQKKTIETQFCYDWFARDYIICSNCHARWHICFYEGHLKWAKLIELDADLKGREYFQIQHKPSFWYDMLLGRLHGKTDVPQSVVREREIVKEKEVIKETEVIVKVKCQYCGKRYNETLDVCPHCGGKP
jgi:hypothetical protein